MFLLAFGMPGAPVMQSCHFDWRRELASDKTGAMENDLFFAHNMALDHLGFKHLNATAQTLLNKKNRVGKGGGSLGWLDWYYVGKKGGTYEPKHMLPGTA